MPLPSARGAGGGANSQRTTRRPHTSDRSRISRWHAGDEPEDAIRISDKPAAARKARDVYAYFDNDAKVHAPFDALALQRALEIPPWQADAPMHAQRHPGRLHIIEEVRRPKPKNA